MNHRSKASLYTQSGMILGLVLFLAADFAPAKDASPKDVSSRKARSALISAVNSGEERELTKALERLVRLGGKKNLNAILRLIRKVSAEDDTTYWALVEGACSFRDDAALEELGKVILDNAREPLARDLVFALSSNKSRRVVLALTPLATSGQRDLAALAVDKLSRIPLPESVDTLIALLKTEEQNAEKTDGSADLLWQILSALKRLTGMTFGPNSVNWDGWWKAQRGKVKLGGRGANDEPGSDTGTAVDSLDPDRKKLLFGDKYGLEEISRRRVIVLSATYSEPKAMDKNNDNIENVLEEMGVPHEVVPRPEFEGYDLSETGAILINCAQFHQHCICPTCRPSGGVNNRLRTCSECDRHILFTARLNQASLKKIEDFVRGGGYVFSEDWVIKEVVEAIFPGYVNAGRKIHTGDRRRAMMVDVAPARGMVTHPYLRGIFSGSDVEEDWLDGGQDEDEEEDDLDDNEDDPDDEDGDEDDDDEDDDDDDIDDGEDEGRGLARPAGLIKARHSWAIDDESWMLSIRRPDKVLVLMKSGRLTRKTGMGSVALAFRPGASKRTIGRKTRRDAAGVVLQVLSHFGKQRSVRDEYLLQNLLINFLIDANVATEARLEAKRKKIR